MLHAERELLLIGAGVNAPPVIKAFLYPSPPPRDPSNTWVAPPRAFSPSHRVPS